MTIRKELIVILKARKFVTIILLIVLVLLTFLGINSVTTIDELAYVVSLGFDIVKETGKLELTFQIAVPSGNSGSSESGSSSESGGSSSQSSSSIVNSVECNTIESGINLVNSYLSKKVNLSHCKAVIFSEEIATMGIGEYIYTLINNVEVRPTCNIIISRCDAKYFLNNAKPILEQLSSKYYEVASISQKTTGYTSNINLQDFFSNLSDTFGESYAILGSVNGGGNSKSDSSASSGNDNTYMASETPIDSQKNVENLGLAVFKGDKLVGELNGLESIAHLTLTNCLKNATISIPSPFESTNYIDLYIVRSKCSNKAKIVNGTPYITPKVKIEARIISMSDDYKYLDDKNIDSIENYASLYVKSYLYDYLYKTSKELKSDIAGFGRYAVCHFWNLKDWDDYNWLDNYVNATFDLDVNVQVKSRYLLIDT